MNLHEDTHYCWAISIILILNGRIEHDNLDRKKSFDGLVRQDQASEFPRLESRMAQ